MKLAAVLLALFAVIAAVLAQTGRTCRSELYEHCARVQHDVRECVECGGPSSTSQPGRPLLVVDVCCLCMHHLYSF